MGRITNLQHQVGELQKALEAKNKAIAATNARDTKIKALIKKFYDEEKSPDIALKLIGEIDKLIS